MFMNWYLAKIIFTIISGNGDHKAQFDEQLRLVQAVSKSAAFEEAKSIGKKAEESYLNEQKELVQWKFINVVDLYQLQGLIHGTEIYSRIEEHDEPDSYIQIIHSKALRISEMKYS